MPQKPLNGKPPILIESGEDRSPCHVCDHKIVNFIGGGSKPVGVGNKRCDFSEYECSNCLQLYFTSIIYTES